MDSIIELHLYLLNVYGHTYNMRIIQIEMFTTNGFSWFAPETSGKTKHGEKKI